jgi:spatacsin
MFMSFSVLSSPYRLVPPFRVYPIHLLREIETRVWLLAVESESRSSDSEFAASAIAQNTTVGNSTSIIEQTADVITKMDNNMSSPRMKAAERNGIRDSLSCQHHMPLFESNSETSVTTTNNTKTKRRIKMNIPLRRGANDNVEGRINDPDNNSNIFHSSKVGEQARNLLSEEEFVKMEASLSGWEQNVRPADMEKAVLSLLEFGQMAAAKQLQQKLSPSYVPEELVLVDIALRVANNTSNGEISLSYFDSEALSVLQSLGVTSRNNMFDQSQVCFFFGVISL